MFEKIFCAAMPIAHRLAPKARLQQNLLWRQEGKEEEEEERLRIEDAERKLKKKMRKTRKKQKASSASEQEGSTKATDEPAEVATTPSLSSGMREKKEDTRKKARRAEPSEEDEKARREESSEEEDVSKKEEEPSEKMSAPEPTSTEVSGGPKVLQPQHPKKEEEPSEKQSAPEPSTTKASGKFVGFPCFEEFVRRPPPLVLSQSSLSRSSSPKQLLSTAPLPTKPTTSLRSSAVGVTQNTEFYSLTDEEEEEEEEDDADIPEATVDQPKGAPVLEVLR